MLGALLLRAVSQKKPLAKREMIITLIIVALYGASDEFHQRFTSGRSSEGLSVLFDVAGGAIGVAVAVAFGCQPKGAVNVIAAVIGLKVAIFTGVALTAVAAR